MNKLNKSHTVLGIMSGTSLDGIDLCLSKFYFESNWKYEIIKCATIPYSKEWSDKLAKADQLSGRDLSELNCNYGKLLGEESKKFLNNSQQKVDLIASHGHTVFHQPQAGFSLQIGHGAYIAAVSNIRTVADFRSSDIAYGGQGAPLVPFGEFHLFPEYEAWMNIGGIANISIRKKDKIIAFDIAAANMALNYVSKNRLGLDFDDNGEIAANGKLQKPLFDKLNQFFFYQSKPPKSLGKEDIFKHIIPLLSESNYSTEDILNTYCHHLCFQMTQTAKKNTITNKKILLSGGGTHNGFLMKLLSRDLSIEIPKKEIIDYKEALIFAFLGLHRYLKSNNILCSVTGAKKDTVGGAIYEVSKSL